MVRRFMTYYRYKIGREINGISDQALLALCSYEWPGNVRELMNVIERAVLLCKTDAISMVELPNVFHGGGSAPSVMLPGANPDEADWTVKTLPEVQTEVMGQIEKLYLQQVLKKTNGRVAEAARIAGIHPRGLYNKMKRLGLRKETFKLKNP
jgi:DNA-binding NtrC family response regulator